MFACSHYKSFSDRLICITLKKGGIGCLIRYKINDSQIPTCKEIDDRLSRINDNLIDRNMVDKYFFDFILKCDMIT